MTSKNLLLFSLPFLSFFLLLGVGCSNHAGNYAEVINEKEGPNNDQLVIETSTSKQDLFFENQETKTSLVIQARSDAQSNRPVLENPFMMYGTTTVFENVFLWRVKDGEDNIVAAGRSYANSPDVGLPGPFEIKAYFDALPQSAEGVLEIYYGSFKDGSDVVLLSKPIKFGELKTQEVEIYFNNNKLDPEMLDCSKVYAVKRMAVVTDPIQDIKMHELLLGPTLAEKNEGFITSLPDYVNQPEVYWQGEGLFMDFDESLQDRIGGSCRVAAIRSQIENTMGDVCTDLGACYIMVNGQQEEVLQP